MAEEIKKDEILSEDQLEEVAGGTAAQTAQALQNFKDMQVIPASSSLSDADLLGRAFKLYGITVKTHNDPRHNNEYIVDSGEFAGINVGEAGAWKIVNKLYYEMGQHKFTT